MTSPRQDAAPDQRATWALEAYARTLSALIHGHDVGGLMQSVCDSVVDRDVYALALVGFAEEGEGHPIRIVARAGRARAYQDGLRMSWSMADEGGRGPAGHAIRSGEPRIVADMATDPIFAPWRERARKHGLRSSVTVPFARPDDTPGIIAVYAETPDAFGPGELALFSQLAHELTFALGVEADRRRLKEAEMSLSAALDEHRMLADNLTDIVIHVGIDGRILYISPSCERQIGFRPEDLIGRQAMDMVHPDDRDAISQRNGALLKDRATEPGYDPDNRVRTAGGDYVWFEGAPRVVFDAEGKPAGWVSLMRNVTQRRALEEELRERRREAEAAAEAKSAFLANMSHEIRTPLTGVVGFARLLDGMADLPVEARRYVDRILTGGETLLAVVNDILDFARIEAGQVELERRIFDPRAFTEETVALVTAEAERKGLGLDLAFAEGFPAWVEGDPVRLRRILLNLLSNAVKFTERGGIAVAAAFGADGPDRLRFEVADTGIGIPPEVGGRLFQRFSQADASINRRFGGTGLGLALCRHLAELMGGDIGFSSEVGAGSTFWVSVPAPPRPAPDAAPDQPQPAPSDALAGPRRILVTDDAPANRELLSAILGAVGHEVALAAGGEEALDLAASEPFDLILMDLQMPGMDGFATAAAIRASDGPNLATPIVAVSANVLPEHVARCRAVGMEGHLAKPIDIPVLLAGVDQWTARPPPESAGT